MKDLFIRKILRCTGQPLWMASDRLPRRSYDVDKQRGRPYALHSTQPHLFHPHNSMAVTLALSQHTHMQHKQQYTHRNHSNHHIHIGYHNSLTDRPKTTTGLQTQQNTRPRGKSERNLIILQVNMNGIKNKLEELKVLIHDTHADIITIQPSSPLKQTHAKYTTSPPCVPIDGTRQEVGSLHSLETTLHSLQQTYLRLLIHTAQNFKWSRYTLTTLNISQLQTFIYLLETPHPRTTKQLTRTYNTAYSTSRTYHTQSAPEM